jgi:hypothetical protein
MTRSDEPLFEPRIADWLEDDPYTAPDQALDVVLAAFPSIKQRRASRVPWRFMQMTTPLRLGLGAAVALIVAVGGLYFLGTAKGPDVGASPAPSPSSEATAGQPSTAAATPRPTAAMTHFVSPRYGYSVDIPSAYQAVPATEDWPPNGAIGPEAAWTDQFRANTNFVGIASQPLPDGSDAGAWLDAYAQSVEHRECGGPATGWTETTVAGHAGRSLSIECGTSVGAEYAWVVDGRGWVVTGEAAVVELILPTLELP